METKNKSGNLKLYNTKSKIMFLVKVFSDTDFVKKTKALYIFRWYQRGGSDGDWYIWES